MASAQEDNDLPQQSSDNQESDTESVESMEAMEEYAQHFAVFCTTQIPADKLDEFIRTVRREYDPSTGVVLNVITAVSELSAPSEETRQRGGTRAPVQDFQTPFQGHSIAALRTLFWEAIQGTRDWADSCFAVLDERFLRDSTVLLVSAASEDEDHGQRLDHRCDARCTLHLLLWYEHKRIGIDWHGPDSEDWDWVYPYD